ncbi:MULTISPECIES: class E sortase [Brevibacterium]|uniref:Sortase A n=1 Tax=Brevibacterium antiquum CNRZ 918 TaxID=1255637 RepID=A0A2H1I8D3_9MICO|nr:MULTISPECIES: class E sortase [Brevibacterium]SMX71374.1 sortase A [Brevibacterium antiquum CNRZ 918]HCG54609.1 class E sortase [Brevibacterium sp.]
MSTAPALGAAANPGTRPHPGPGSHSGTEQPLPSRRELRRREAEAAAADGAPTAVYSDAPPVYPDSTQPQPVANSGTDPRLGASGGAAAADRDGGRRSRGRKQKPEREPLGPVRGTIRTFGELCITAGMVLILFVVWQLVWTDFEANRDNEVLADKLTEDWSNQDPNELPDDPDEPVVADPVEKNHAFGIFYIPRFGDDYYRTAAEGVDLEPVLNRMGVGRYPNSAMPGEVGNFSIAGHRVTYGKPLNQIAKLRPGDEIVVQTKDGFYTYTFRNFDIILPDAVEVLAPVPNEPTYKGKDRILTMTACNPMFSARERYIAYAELTDWTPAGNGAPENIKDSKAYDKVSKNGGA